MSSLPSSACSPTPTPPWPRSSPRGNRPPEPPPARCRCPRAAPPPPPGGAAAGGDLLVAPPRHGLEQLADLDRQRDRQVLGRVEAFPLPFGREAAQVAGQVVERHGPYGTARPGNLHSGGCLRPHIRMIGHPASRIERFCGFCPRGAGST